MKKYLGIVKKENNSVTKSLKVLTRFSDDKSYLERWFKSFSGSEHIILDNNEELQDFFRDFEDYSLVSKE